MNKIQKISSYFLILINLLLIGLPILEVLFWFLPINQSVNNFGRSIPIINGMTDMALLQLAIQSKFIGFIGSLVGLIPILLGLSTLKKFYKLPIC